MAARHLRQSRFLFCSLVIFCCCCRRNRFFRCSSCCIFRRRSTSGRIRRLAGCALFIHALRHLGSTTKTKLCLIRQLRTTIHAKHAHTSCIVVTEFSLSISDEAVYFGGSYLFYHGRRYPLTGSRPSPSGITGESTCSSSRMCGTRRGQCLLCLTGRTEKHKKDSGCKIHCPHASHELYIGFFIPTRWSRAVCS